MFALMHEEFGAPEVLHWRSVPDAKASIGEAVVRIEAAGLNFADVYRRRGRWHPAGSAPWIPGYEGAGVIVALATDTANSGFNIGDRVGFADSPNANAELASVLIDKLIKLPDSIPTKTAAAVLLQGLTAHYLSRDSYAIQSEDWIVVHAAGGGVGLLLVQIAKLLGAKVIGLASSPEKRAAAAAVGADFVLCYENWVSEVRRLSGGGAHAVYDSIGTTLVDSLAALRKKGHAVFFGMAGGDPVSVDPRLLMENSLTLTGGDLWNVLVSAEERRRRASELFKWIEEGHVRVTISRTVAMQDGAEAHRFLESRAAIGKVLLTVDKADT